MSGPSNGFLLDDVIDGVGEGRYIDDRWIETRRWTSDGEDSLCRRSLKGHVRCLTGPEIPRQCKFAGLSHDEGDIDTTRPDLTVDQHHGDHQAEGRQPEFLGSGCVPRLEVELIIDGLTPSRTIEVREEVGDIHGSDTVDDADLSVVLQGIPIQRRCEGDLSQATCIGARSADGSPAKVALVSPVTVKPPSVTV